MWEVRPSVITYLTLAGLLYSLGWLRLRSIHSAFANQISDTHRPRRLATGWRLGCYLSGLAVLGLALMSPIDVLGGSLFFMHMIQHLLLIMIAPPLLLLADPFPFMIWGLPGGGLVGERLFSAGAGFRRALRQATHPGMVWMTFVAILWGWHDPYAYDAALRFRWVHDLEHLTFFGAAMLLWWHVIGAGPRIHSRLPPLARIGYLLATAVANMIPGVVIALADVPLYNYYIEVPRLWGFTVMQDQVLSGILMWIPGTMMYFLAALIIILRTLSHSETWVMGNRLPKLLTNN